MDSPIESVETSCTEEAQVTVSDDAGSVEEIEETELEEDNAALTFLDVFGESHETQIVEGFPKKEYRDEFFARDGEKVFYEDEKYTSRFGIDVSNKEQDIDWDKVQEFGVDFVIIRLGYRGYGSLGDIHLDLHFHENMKAAQERGMDVGVYFFSQAINEEEAIEEAKFVLENIEGYELKLPIVYDPESILDDEARTDDVTAEQFTKNSIAFCEYIKAAGYEPMIYANMMWEAYELEMEKLSDYSFWYADYEKYPQTPYAFSMWQYTESGDLEGITAKKVDFNVMLVEKE